MGGLPPFETQIILVSFEFSSGIIDGLRNIISFTITYNLLMRI